MREKLSTYGALATLILIWGTTWAAIRVGLEGIPPFTGVALRFAIASALLLGVALTFGVRLQWTRRAVSLGLVNGLFSFTLSYGVVYWAEQWVPSGLAAILFATFPLFVALTAHLLLPGERLTRRALAGILLGFAGVVTIFSEDLGGLLGGSATLAAAIFLISPLSSAVANVVIKRWGEGVHPLSLTVAPMGLTAVLMGLTAAVFERRREIVFDRVSVAALIYLAVAGTAITFVLYFWLLSRLAATRLSLITYGVPVVAVAVGSLFLGEPFTSRMAVGSVLVLAGVVLAVRRGWRRAAPRRSS